MSSHVLAEVEQTVDDVLIISKGRLLAQAPIGELGGGASRRRAGAVTSGGTPASSCWSRAARPSIASKQALAIRGPDAAEVGQLALDNGIVLHELLTEQPSLEDVFLAIAGTRRETP